METEEVSQLKARVGKLEQQSFEEFLTLLEIVSNASFFGDLKKSSCDYAKAGQCSFFVLKKGAQEKIPIVTRCRIRTCPEEIEHFHIETSNITCTLCPHWHSNCNGQADS